MPFRWTKKERRFFLRKLRSFFISIRQIFNEPCLFKGESGICFAFQDRPAGVVNIDNPFLAKTVIDKVADFFSKEHFILNGDFYIHLPVNGLFHQLQTFRTDAQAVFLPCIYALRSGNSVVSVRNSIFSQPFYAEEVVVPMKSATNGVFGSK